MRLARALSLIGAAMALGLAGVPMAAAPPLSAPSPQSRFVIGAQTHFSQGWPATALPLARRAEIGALRDSLPWSKVETGGRLDFTVPIAAPLRSWCRGGGDLLLTVQPIHPPYDGGMMVTSAQGLTAFGRYVDGLVRSFGPCLVAIEVGNEINGPRGLKFAAGTDPIAGYVAALRTAYRAAHEANPHVRILGASTNAIGTGFVARVLDAGGGAAMDGIAVHPYRQHPENVDVEIARLAAVARAKGAALPIWATEFSDNFASPAAAAPHLVKMATLLAAGPVERAYWYALLDQSWFRNMGLYTEAGQPKPAALAMRLVTGQLVPAGRPHRIDVGDPALFLYRWGDRGPLVAWGASREIRFDGAARVFDSTGRALPDRVVTLGDEPVVVEDATGWHLGSRGVLADSFLGYGRAPWSYRVRKPGGETPLGLFDDRFSSYFGAAAFRPLRLSDYGAAPAGDARGGLRPVLRYTAPQDEQVTVSTCFTKHPQGDGVDVAIEHDGAVVRQGVLTDRLAPAPLTLALRRGDTVDTVFVRHGGAGGAALRYRVRILAVSAATPTAPACL